MPSKFQIIKEEIINFFTIFVVVAVLAFGIAILAMIGITKYYQNKSSEVATQWYGGYYPGEIYEIFDKNTGVYYGITDTGYAFPLYTINGELRLVDQGNEYVVHKNLGEPDAEE